MNLKEYRKQITALQKESGEYAVNKAPLGKEVQAQAIARQAEIKEMLNPDSAFLLSVATQENSLSALSDLIAEQAALHTMLSNYHFRTISERGSNKFTHQIELVQEEFKQYFVEHIDDKEMLEMNLSGGGKFIIELRELQAKHKAKKAKEAELKVLVDPFMTDLNKLLEQPHITRYDLSSMQKKARSISPECITAADKLHQMPLLA